MTHTEWSWFVRKENFYSVTKLIHNIYNVQGRQLCSDWVSIWVCVSVMSLPFPPLLRPFVLSLVWPLFSLGPSSPWIFIRGTIRVVSSSSLLYRVPPARIVNYWWSLLTSRMALLCSLVVRMVVVAFLSVIRCLLLHPLVFLTVQRVVPFPLCLRLGVTVARATLWSCWRRRLFCPLFWFWTVAVMTSLVFCFLGLLSLFLLLLDLLPVTFLYIVNYVPNKHVIRNYFFAAVWGSSPLFELDDGTLVTWLVGVVGVVGVSGTLVAAVGVVGVVGGAACFFFVSGIFRRSSFAHWLWSCCIIIIRDAERLNAGRSTKRL